MPTVPAIIAVLPRPIRGSQSSERVTLMSKWSFSGITLLETDRDKSSTEMFQPLIVTSAEYFLPLSVIDALGLKIPTFGSS